MSVLVVSTLLLAVRQTGGLDLKIECLAEAYRGSVSTGWKGYTVEELSLPTLGKLQFTLAFPGDWTLSACCQKLQLKFNDTDLEPLVRDQGYLLPRAEWTLCSQDIRLYTCYGFILRDIMIHKSQIPTGSWWINIQHCFQPHQNAISYEIGTFGAAKSSESDTPRYSGTAKVIKLASLQGNITRFPPPNPCLVDGEIDTDAQWFGYLAKMDIAKESSISYRFVFNLQEPSNEAALMVLFYTQSDLDSVSDQNTCEGRTKVLSTAQNSYKLLPLSISNVWSGCFVDNSNGSLTFICEGGRTLAEQQTVNIAVSNCKLTQGLQFHYFLEFLHFQNGCPTGCLSGPKECVGGPETLGQRLVSDSVSASYQPVYILMTICYLLLTYMLLCYC